MKKKFVFTLIFLPIAAQAYVDPGVMAVLYQMGYAAFFGIMAFLVFRPWAWIKSTLGIGKKEEAASMASTKSEEESNTAEPTPPPVS